MTISNFPGLRILLVLLVCYILADIFVIYGIVFLGICFLLLVLFKRINFKNALVFFLISVLFFMRLSFIDESNLDKYYYKISKVLKDDNKTLTCIGEGDSRVLLKVRGSYQKVLVNDIWLVKSRLRKAKDPKSLIGFIYHDYIKNMDIDSIGFFNEKSKMVYRDSSSIIFHTSILKHKLVDYYLSFDSVSIPVKGVIIALMTGDKSFLSKEQKTLFRETGVLHVLAISGLHVGILFMTLSFVFQKLLRLSPKLVFVIISFFLICYAFMTGLSPSVVRAVLMFVLIQFGNSFLKEVDTLNIVFTSCSLMLFYNPKILYEVGFQLSYFAVLGIILTIKYLKVLKVTNSKFEFLVTLLKVNLGAFLFTLPILSYHFGTINITSVLASFIVVPIISLAMYLGLLLTLLIPITALAEKAFFLFEIVIKSAEWILSWITLKASMIVEFEFSFFGAMCWVCVSVFLLVEKKLFIYLATFSLALWCIIPNQAEFKILSVEKGFQIKIDKKIYELKVGDEIEVNRSKIKALKKNKIVIKNLKHSKYIDFNVNKYQNVIVDI